MIFFVDELFSFFHFCNFFQNFVFNFFTSFGYFDSKRENLNALTSMTNAMKKEGSFVMDYLNIKYTELHLISEEEKNTEEILFKIKRWFDEQNFYKKIDIHDPSLDNTLTYTEQVARFSLDDFKCCLLQMVFGFPFLFPKAIIILFIRLN